MAQAEDGKVGTITEESLVKSLAELEGKVVTTEPATTAPVVEVAPLAKKAGDTLSELGSENLKKALDVSEVLDEAVALMGVHVDRSLEQMQKSIALAAQRDLGILGVLTALKKSIDDNTETVKKLLDAPAAPAGTRPVVTDAGQVLTKSVVTEPIAASTPATAADLKKSILDGLETLVKSANVTSSEGARLSSALVKFESTGQISDADMTAALKTQSSK